MGAVVMNAAAVASVDFSAGHGAAWILLLTRTLTFAVTAIGAHVVVGGLRRAHAAAALRADTDSITGSVSRSRLHDVLDAHLWHGGSEAAAGVGLILIDVDHFKRINDTFGHLAGDDGLRGLVDRLTPMLREGDAIGRWGGEEFLVVAPGIADRGALAAVCEKIRTTVADRPIPIGGQTVKMTVSVGATIAKPGAPVREFLAAADDALYAAKRRGRNRCHIASPRLTAFDVGAEASALGGIRQEVRRAAAAAGLADEQLNDVALAVSEACASMVTSGGGRRSLHVTTHDRTDCFTVTIRDPGPGTADVPDPRDEPELSDAIVGMLAREVRSDRHDGENEVSMLFAKEPSEPALV
jgi:diguanylate cyclase (GGDEF)-like protein